MKITIDEMWESINAILFPGKEITAQECGYVIPEALKDCAVRIITAKHVDWHILNEYYVIEALRELKQNGLLEFTGN